jgi:hypothetical protein
VDSPTGIAQIQGTVSDFGPRIVTTTPSVPLVFTDPLDACSPLQNSNQLNGSIAIIYRGNCSFTNKVYAAQQAGAVAVVVVNDVPGTIIMTGINAQIHIPAISITTNDGNLLQECSSDFLLSAHFTAATYQYVYAFNYTNWPFSSTRHWGELSNGIWTLSVTNKQTYPIYTTGGIKDWTLKIYYSNQLNNNNALRLGLGLGLGLGIPLLILIIVGIYCCRKKSGGHLRFND